MSNSRDAARHEEDMRHGHCGHAPKCLGVGYMDDRDPLGCCRCGDRLREVAPDLLAACETLLALYDETEHTYEAAYYAFFKHGAAEMWESVRGKIAKARGTP